MKTVSINLYQFNELSEDAKQKAIENLYDINLDYEWWENTYEDASNIGLKIKEFDIDRGGYVKGKFTLPAYDVSCKIIQEHGKDCETYKTALQFGKDWSNLVEKYSDGINKYEVTEDNEYEFDKDVEELEDEFLKSLCEDYRIILQQDYEYRTGKEAIIETIEANEYYFTEDGQLS